MADDASSLDPEVVYLRSRLTLAAMVASPGMPNMALLGGVLSLLMKNGTPEERKLASAVNSTIAQLTGKKTPPPLVGIKGDRDDRNQTKAAAERADTANDSPDNEI